MVFQKLGRKKLNTNLRSAGIGHDTREKVSSIFGDKRKTKIKEGVSKSSFKKKLSRETDLSYSERQRVMKAYKGSSQDPKKVYSPSRPNKKEVFSGDKSSKPKTSWWQAIRGGGSKSSGSSSTGGSDLSSVRSRPGSPSFTSSSGNSSNKPPSTSSRGESLGEPSPSSVRGSGLPDRSSVRQSSFNRSNTFSGKRDIK
ncbi:MAG: hypothetical protein HQ538_04110 [Parcubacteria group bacterium]|nr:hypothetical protein [Parcubacteria group bacterium]